MARQPALHRPARREFGRAAVLVALVACLSAVSGCGSFRAPERVAVSLAGSQIAVELVDSWLTASRDPEFVTRQIGRVYLSQNGFEALAGSQADLACTDRPIEPRELESLGQPRPLGRRVAFYGFALYVHPDNKLDSIFIKHFPLVLKRRIQDWRQLAAEDVPGLAGPITVYGPRKNSRGGMLLMIQADIWFADPPWIALDSDAEIIARVRQDPTALGFAGVGLDQGVRYLGVRLDRTGPPVFPSLDEIEADRYGLAKVIYIYARPGNPAFERVMQYLHSPAGQEAMRDTNVWPIPPERATVDPT